MPPEQPQLSGYAMAELGREISSASGLPERCEFAVREKFRALQCTEWRQFEPLQIDMVLSDCHDTEQT
jgi:hypothetical protein